MSVSGVHLFIYPIHTSFSLDTLCFPPFIILDQGEDILVRSLSESSRQVFRKHKHRSSNLEQVQVYIKAPLVSLDFLSFFFLVKKQ